MNNHLHSRCESTILPVCTLSSVCVCVCVCVSEYERKRERLKQPVTVYTVYMSLHLSACA